MVGSYQVTHHGSRTLSVSAPCFDLSFSPLRFPFDLFSRIWTSLPSQPPQSPPQKMLLPTLLPSLLLLPFLFVSSDAKHDSLRPLHRSGSTSSPRLVVRQDEESTCPDCLTITDIGEVCLAALPAGTLETEDGLPPRSEFEKKRGLDETERFVRRCISLLTLPFSLILDRRLLLHPRALRPLGLVWSMPQNRGICSSGNRLSSRVRR